MFDSMLSSNSLNRDIANAEGLNSSKMYGRLFESFFIAAFIFFLNAENATTKNVEILSVKLYLFFIEIFANCDNSQNNLNNKQIQLYLLQYFNWSPVLITKRKINLKRQTSELNEFFTKYCKNKNVAFL